MRDPKNQMWAEACAMLKQAEALHRQFFEPSREAARWEPPVDVFETERQALDHRRAARRGARGRAGRHRRTDADHRRAPSPPNQGAECQYCEIGDSLRALRAAHRPFAALAPFRAGAGQWLSRAHFRQAVVAESLVQVMNDTEHFTPQSAEAPQSPPSEAQTAAPRASGGARAAARPARRRRSFCCRPAMPCCFPASWRRSRSAARSRSPARKPPPKPTSRSACCCRTTPRSIRPAPSICIASVRSAEILRYVTAPDGNHHLVARGTRRFRVLEFLPGYPYLVARIDEVGEAEVYSTEIAARMHQLKERAREAISLLPNVPTEIAGAIEQMQSPSQLADFIANVSDLTPAEKQDLLETFDVARAARQAVALSRAADRGVAPVEADRRADAGVAGRAAARAHSARAASPDPEGAWRRRRGPGRDRRIARSRSRRPACRKRPRSRR